MRRRRLLLGIAASVLTATVVIVWRYWPTRDIGHHEQDIDLPSFSGSSDQLERTVVVPTLETPLPAGKSAVWCATLALAWQRLEQDVLKEPADLDGDGELARQLSRQPAVALLPEHHYVAAGFLKDGIQDRIRRELVQRFPRAHAPPDRPASERGVLAYAYLETSIRYEFMFNDIEQPMKFTDGQGTVSSVRAYGIREEDKGWGGDTYRQQVKVLFRKGDDFALDLSQNTRPYQIIVARMARKATLRETLTELENRTAAGPAPSFGKEAILGVPVMNWAVDHRFQELHERVFRNPALPPHSFIEEASQFIRFRTDRRGADLHAGVLLGTDWNGSHPEDYRLDRPYLIVLKHRDCQHPFFVMWVENVELLQVR